MNTQVIDSAINELVTQIDTCQRGIQALRAVKGLNTERTENGVNVLAPRRGPKPLDVRSTKRATKPTAEHKASVVAAQLGAQKSGLLHGNTPPQNGEKPNTVAGAIKFLLRDETQPFTRAELIENLQDDPDYKKLLEAEGGAKSLENALYHWSSAGKLKKDGDNYTVTAAGKEWFNR